MTALHLVVSPSGATPTNTPAKGARLAPRSTRPLLRLVSPADAYDAPAAVPTYADPRQVFANAVAHLVQEAGRERQMSLVEGTQAFADASNALAMAAYYLRQPVANVPGAMRKTAQALAALRAFSFAIQGGAV